MVATVGVRDALGMEELAVRARARERVVVCNIAGSASDAATVEVAAQLASLARARLVLVAVAPIAAHRQPDEHGWTLAEARRGLELTAETLAARAGVDCVLELGNPTRRLVEVAAKKRALLLVVAAGGERGSATSIVAAGIARSASCPVVVVPTEIGRPELDAAPDA